MTHSALLCDRRYFATLPKIIFLSTIIPLDALKPKHARIAAFILVCMMTTFAHAEEPKSVLSVPPDWRIENTTYPPVWAKSLPWKGKIELRFPPGFFEPTSKFFWSYPILYQLRGNCITNDAELKRALLDYDAGLYGGKYLPKQINITIENPKPRQPDQPQTVTFKGYDPFTTKKPLTTYLEIQRRFDSRTDTTTILILRSPRPINKRDAVWQTLYRFRKDAGF
jgi:hypothetical protein